MKKTFYVALLWSALALGASAQANIKLNETTLMHEMRATPYPLDKAVVADRSVSFQWPLPGSITPTGVPMDGYEDQAKKIDKSKVAYKIRYAQDAGFTKGVVEADTRWPFYNPDKPLEAGTWYWQYGYVENGQTQWSPTYQITVEDNPKKFCPPSLKELLAKVPKTHPRVWIDKAGWDSFIKNSQSKPERADYLGMGGQALQTPMKTLKDIDTGELKKLQNDMQIKSYLTRQSRQIIDGEELNTDMLVRCYLLTKDRRYGDEAVKRVLEMLDWDKNPNVQGDFNAATLLSLSSLVYDSCYDLLTDAQKKILLDAIREKGTSFYDNFNNRLENHIADNHVWQMTLRIFTFAAFSVYGELPEADTWVDYCYNVWLARFPGLNKDGGWHNGDMYFTVNSRTLVEVPYFYSRLTGFDFFSDPWYTGNIMYTMYQCPPFQAAGGNGSAHLRVGRPNAIRIGYLDALARLCHNSFAADFVRRTLKVEPDYLKKAYRDKAGNLGWFRLQCDTPLPEGPGLTSLLPGYVFPETGLASFMTNWDRVGGNAMWSFRSSPYGSTSHALANQNSFNTFYGGKPLFYSSGHHIEFTDKHAMLCHRATRAHNTILVNGMGQRIGTEGYGWIPRYYVSDKIGYVLGDASNAYGKVISPLWLERGEQSDVAYTPENGWDDVPLTKFRRHIVNLGNTGYIFIYDELEASEPADYTYMLHTVLKPMTVDTSNPRFVHVQAVSGRGGASDAYLFSSGALQVDTTSQFFYPAKDWLKSKGKELPNHWHFTAKSEKSKVYRFMTIINTHAEKYPSKDPEILSDGRIKAGGWLISVNLSSSGAPSFFIRSTKDDVNITYKGQETIVNENGYVTTMRDVLPDLEI